MAKEVKGWRDPQSWDYSGGDATIKAISELSRSDDGWVCPHCGEKESMEGSEMRNQEVMELIFSGEMQKVYCNQCGKEYFLQCYTRFRYSSCADEKFEEEE